MDRDQFIAVVRRVAGVGEEAAERATRATLQTLAERLSPEETRDLVERLPPELGPWLASDRPAEGFDLDTFLGRVAERAEVDLAAAERRARAVLTALARAVGDDEYADMVAQLPKDYAMLLPRGPAVEVQPVEVLLAKVARRAELRLSDPSVEAGATVRSRADPVEAAFGQRWSQRSGSFQGPLIQ